MEKRSTLTPQRRATQKWPNSWMVTSTPSVTAVIKTICTIFMPLPINAAVALL